MSEQRIPPNSRLKYEYVAIMGDKRVLITRKQRDWLKAKKGGPAFTHWPATVRQSEAELTPVPDPPNEENL